MDTDPVNPGPKDPASSGERVELRSFSEATAAEIAKASLLARGIECWLTADDCGGMYAAMDAVQGVKLFVRRSDRDAALALLKEEGAGGISHRPETATVTETTGEATTPRIKLSFPQLITGIVTGILLCLLYQWTSRLGTKTDRYDWNGDGRTDAVYIYKDGWCVQICCDRNRDGKLDLWDHFEPDGRHLLSRADDNFDGVPDVTWNYTNGVLATSQADTDFNGTPDVTHTFKYDLFALSEWRPNGTSVITLRQVYERGLLIEESRDTNWDGTFDLTVRYDAFQNPIQTNILKLLTSGVGN